MDSTTITMPHHQLFMLVKWPQIRHYHHSLRALPIHPPMPEAFLSRRHFQAVVGVPVRVIPDLKIFHLHHPQASALASRRAHLHTKSWQWRPMASPMLISSGKVVSDLSIEECCRMVKKWPLSSWRSAAGKVSESSRQRLKSSAVFTIDIWFHWLDIALLMERDCLFMSLFQTIHSSSICMVKNWTWPLYFFVLFC